MPLKAINQSVNLIITVSLFESIMSWQKEEKMPFGIELILCIASIDVTILADSFFLRV